MIFILCYYKILFRLLLIFIDKVYADNPKIVGYNRVQRNNSERSPIFPYCQTSSLHNIILNAFRLVFVLWSLLLRVELSLSYVIVVQKSYSGDGKFTLYG